MGELWRVTGSLDLVWPRMIWGQMRSQLQLPCHDRPIATPLPIIVTHRPWGLFKSWPIHGGRNISMADPFYEQFRRRELLWIIIEHRASSMHWVCGVRVGHWVYAVMGTKVAKPYRVLLTRITSKNTMSHVKSVTNILLIIARLKMFKQCFLLKQICEIVLQELCGISAIK